MLVDIHTHHTQQRRHLEVVNIRVMNKEPQPAVPNEYFSAGIHPWDAGTTPFQTLLPLLNAPHCLAVGEAGLDRLKGPALNIQIPVFEQQIRIAASINKPLVIHSVRTQNEVIGLLKNQAGLPPVIIHGFNGKLTVARRWADEGYYLSFGAALLQKKEHLSASLRAVPINRLFFETDEAASKIDDIYQCACEILGMDRTIVEQQIEQNFMNLFFPHGKLA